MSEPSRRVIPEQGEFDEEPGEGRPPRRASRTWLVRGLGVALGIIHPGRGGHRHRDRPHALLIPAALAATCAFMLPVGTPPNAIVFATGNVKISEMVRGGIVLNVVGVLLITIFTVLIGPFALGLVL
ncbi:anion permease [Pseudarthrobacter oxydans]|uniref:anion permease n=1 Tax=Pseudarthrobacter oxydans TaxID=1671 RepID=UPI003806B989